MEDQSPGIIDLYQRISLRDWDHARDILASNRDEIDALPPLLKAEFLGKFFDTGVRLQEWQYEPFLFNEMLAMRAPVPLRAMHRAFQSLYRIEYTETEAACERKLYVLTRLDQQMKEHGFTVGRNPTSVDMSLRAIPPEFSEFLLGCSSMFNTSELSATKRELLELLVRVFRFDPNTLGRAGQHAHAVSFGIERHNADAIEALSEARWVDPQVRLEHEDRTRLDFVLDKVNNQPDNLPEWMRILHLFQRPEKRAQTVWAGDKAMFPGFGERLARFI